MTETIQVGQTVYWRSQYDRPSETRSGVVHKIGRRWVTLNHDNGDRFDKSTMLMESWNGCGPRIWLSKEAYEDNLIRLRLLTQVQKFFRDYTKPDELSRAQLETVMSAIGLEPEAKAP